MSTRIVGLHSGHGALACLLVDNVLVSAIARERLTRRKHDQGDPVECVDYLLAHFELTPADIDLLICSDWHDAIGLCDALAKRMHDISSLLCFGREQTFGVNPDWQAFLQSSPNHIDWNTLWQPIWRTRDVSAEPNMLSAALITDMSRARYPALAHIDGTVRLQVVEEDGGLLHQLLVAYKGLTGPVAQINISFNGRGESMLETLAQARAYTVAIGLDHLYANGMVEDVHV